jgi:hypothetical protein
MRLLPPSAPRTPGELEARFTELDLDGAAGLFEPAGSARLTSDLVVSGYDLRHALALLIAGFDGTIWVNASDTAALGDELLIRAAWRAEPRSPRGVTLRGTSHDVARVQADGGLLYEENLWADWDVLA